MMDAHVLVLTDELADMFQRQHLHAFPVRHPGGRPQLPTAYTRRPTVNIVKLFFST